MGLDMYLYKDYYIGGEYDHRGVRGTVDLEVEEGSLKLKPSQVHSIRERVAYWRKANAIHGWFVQKVQDGVDECQESPVDVEQLRRLRDLCAELLESQDEREAMKRLPPQSGFFFGSGEIDEYYWEGLKYTVETLGKILAEPIDRLWIDFVYQASW